MSKVLITGASGFIGINLINYLNSKLFIILPFSRNLGMDYEKIDSNYINKENIKIIIHLAGKAHDLKNVSTEEEYFKANTELTIKIFDAFLKSNAESFLYFSSVKAAKDHLDCILTEEIVPEPITAYGKSKLTAEIYLLSKILRTKKRIIILRPCMIHGPSNKGNLNLLYNLVYKNIPWPLGSYYNNRSFCSIDNLSFIVNEIISRSEIPSGIYNIADDHPISTNQIIELIAESQNRKPFILKINRNVINLIARLGDFANLPINTERLTKLTETYVVSNAKIKNAIGKDLPLSTTEGLLKTFHSFMK